MDTKQEDIQLIKDKLIAYREGELAIESNTEALERLVNQLEGVGAVNITDMPRSPSPPRDRMSDLISQKIELEEDIGADIEAQRQERQRLKHSIKKLKSADEKAVITFRYLRCMAWEDVTDAMYGGKADYLDKYDSYARRTYYVHGRALCHLAKIEAKK